MRNQVWQWGEQGQHYTHKFIRFIWVEVQYKLQTIHLIYLISVIDCIRKGCALSCIEREETSHKCGGKELSRSLPGIELITPSWTEGQYWKHNMIPSYIYLSILLRTRDHSSRSSMIWSLPPMVVSANNIQLWKVKLGISSDLDRLESRDVLLLQIEICSNWGMSDLLCLLCLTPELWVRRECLSWAGQCKDRLEAAGQNTHWPSWQARLAKATFSRSDTNTGPAHHSTRINLEFIK